MNKAIRLMSREECLQELHLKLQGILIAIDGSGLRPATYEPVSFRCTRELCEALEDHSDPATRAGLLISFTDTMMGYENNVLGLEERGLLPEGFARRTYELVQALRFGSSPFPG